MKEVSTARLVVLRATYLLLVVGLGVTIWPGVLHPPAGLGHMASVVRSLLAAIGLLALLGVRYPLRMLPLLLFELAWKSIWLLAFGIALWRANAFTPDTRDTWHTLLISVVLFLVVIPWPYVWSTYARERGARWWTRAPETGSALDGR